MEPNLTKRDMWIGHVLRRECVLKTIVEGAVKGRNAKGRPRDLSKLPVPLQTNHRIYDASEKNEYTVRATDDLIFPFHTYLSFRDFYLHYLTSF